MSVPICGRGAPRTGPAPQDETRKLGAGGCFHSIRFGHDQKFLFFLDLLRCASSCVACIAKATLSCICLDAEWKMDDSLRRLREEIQSPLWSSPPTQSRRGRSYKESNASNHLRFYSERLPAFRRLTADRVCHSQFGSSSIAPNTVVATARSNSWN
jgi:hypothetical protein